MTTAEDLILKAIDNRLAIHEQSMPFDKTYYGKVVSINGDKIGVSINDAVYNAAVRNGLMLNIGDVVIVKAPNGNFSYVYIDCKLGSSSSVDIESLNSYVQSLKGDLEGQISISNGQLNEFKFYKGFSELGQTVGYENISDFTRDMNPYSIAILIVGSSNNGSQYPNGHKYGTLTIFKNGNDRTKLEYTYADGSKTFYCAWNRIAGISKWLEVSTTDKVDLLLLNGWTNATDVSSNKFRATKVGSVVTLSGAVKAGTVSHPTTIAELPVGYRPLSLIAGVVLNYRKAGLGMSFGINTNGAIAIYNRPNEWTPIQNDIYIFNFSYEVG